MELSLLRQALIAQRFEHLGSNILSFPSQIEGNNGSFITNPDNIYGKISATFNGLTYGPGFESQYGDRGPCADMAVWEVNSLYTQMGIPSPISMKTGLGFGTSTIENWAESVGAKISNTPSLFVPGNYITMTQKEGQVITGENYDGHLGMILSITPREDGTYHVTTADAGFVEGRVNVIHWNYDGQNTLRQAFSNGQVPPHSFARQITGIIDVDKLPSAQMVEEKLKSTPFKPVLVHGTYGIRDTETITKEATTALESMGIDINSFYSASPIKLAYDELSRAYNSTYESNFKEIFNHATELALASGVNISKLDAQEIILKIGWDNPNVQKLLLSSSLMEGINPPTVAAYINQEMSPYWNRALGDAIYKVRSGGETLTSSEALDKALEILKNGTDISMTARLSDKLLNDYGHSDPRVLEILRYADKDGIAHLRQNHPGIASNINFMNEPAGGATTRATELTGQTP